MEATKLPSRYQPGDPVAFSLDGENRYGATVGMVHFTESKVKYDLELSAAETRIDNIDSAFVSDLWDTPPPVEP